MLNGATSMSKLFSNRFDVFVAFYYIKLFSSGSRNTVIGADVGRKELSDSGILRQGVEEII
jgi:hypothetical protein